MSDAITSTIARLRESLEALSVLNTDDVPAFDAETERARALDALRAVELREEEHARLRYDDAERRAARAEYAAYLAQHLAIAREQTEALRAILAEVTRPR